MKKILLLQFFLLFTSFSFAQSRMQDSLALVDFYNSTGGSNWIIKWDLSKPMTSWWGVNLGDGGRVIDLNNDAYQGLPGFISGNNISGTLPASIGNLTKLTTLIIKAPNSQLTGNIPTTIGNLTELVNLEIFYTQLTGAIPTSIGNLTKLRSLFLYENQLTGNIPASIGNLRNLDYLGLARNQLTGNIPTEIGNLAKLTTLSLTSNQLSGSLPSSIGNLTNLTSLEISDNKLTGSIPTSIDNLTKLTGVFLSNNQLTGILPTIINRVRDMRVPRNKFTFKDLINYNSTTATGYFEYAPQDSVFRDTTLSINIANTFTINLGIDVGITANVYKWYRNGTLIRQINGDPSITINDLKVSDAGIYTCVITNPNYSSLSLYSRNIKLNVLCPSPPSVSITTGTTSICTGQTTTLTATAGLSSYKWSNGQTTQSVTVSNAATYTVTVSEAYGCTNTASTTVVVNSIPVVTISGLPTICSGQGTTLTAPTGLSSYRWSNNATTQSITVNAAGTYSVVVTNASGCSNTANININIINPPSVSITGTITICDGQSTTLTASGGVSSYLWSNNATTQNINVNTAGTYTVTVTSSNGCKNTATSTVSINNPVVSISGSSTICSGQSTALSATSGFSTYRWSNNTTTQSINVSANGDYSVTATDAKGCTATSTKSVTIGSGLTPSITGNATICSGNNTVLTASGGTTYLWSTGATTSSITVTTSGTYTVTATSGDGCKGSTSKVITSTALPTVSITGSTSFCTAGSTTLTATGGVSYKWSSGQTTPSVSISQAGTYTVTATDANGCTATATKTITIGGALNPTIVGINSICSGASTTLTASGGTNYLWSNGATTPIITVTTPATYTVTVSNAEGCSGTISRVVSTFTSPTVNISGNSSFCAGDNTTLTASGGVSYVWSDGQMTPSVLITQAGTYTVTATDINGCRATASKDILVGKIEGSITVKDFSNICKGDKVTLTASGGTKYLWSNGINVAEMVVTPTETTEYTVTITSGNCTDVKKQTITVTPKPIADFDAVVVGSKVTFTNKSVGATTYFWTFGSNETSTLKNPEIQFKTSGNQYVCLIALISTTCGDTKCKTITTTPIQELPNDLAVTISPNPTSGVVAVKIDYYRQFRPEEKITVYDWLGRNVYEKSDLNSLNNLDISNLSNGIYLFRLTLDGKTYTLEKIVKAN